MTPEERTHARHRRARDVSLLLVAIALIVGSGGVVFKALVGAPSDAAFASLYVLAVLVVVLVRVLTRGGDGRHG